jgi:hypothetical protein
VDMVERCGVSWTADGGMLGYGRPLGLVGAERWIDWGWRGRVRLRVTGVQPGEGFHRSTVFHRPHRPVSLSALSTSVRILYHNAPAFALRPAITWILRANSTANPVSCVAVTPSEPR